MSTEDNYRLIGFSMWRGMLLDIFKIRGRIWLRIGPGGGLL
jgi:hypothetical protein